MKQLVFVIVIQLLSNILTAQYKTELTVAQDGSGDFTSIQEAIDNTKSFPERAIKIYIKKGVYKEKIKVHNWNNNLSLIGEDARTTIIEWNDHFDKINRGRNSTFHTSTLLVQADNFHAENLTISNIAGPVGQAIALAVEADRCTIFNCRILGHQDTLYAAGSNTRQHYKQCYIEGTTDFIFGEATVLFEDCIIHSKHNSYITAASTPQGRNYGFVFYRCQLTAAPGITEVYLGRPWRSFAKTAFIYCEMGAHIHPMGWHNWSSPEKEKTSVYAEYGNTGAGADIAKRVSWCHLLSKRKAKKYLPEKVLDQFILPSF